MKSLLIVCFLTSFSAQAFEGRAHRFMDESFKEALISCHEELGIERPARGERPSEQDREKMKLCLSEKGIDLPQKGHRKRE